MKKSLFFVCLFGIVMGNVSCDHRQEEPQNAVTEVTIYGNVIDRATGQPLYNVLIQEKNKVGGSTVTGNDGNYEFTLPLNGSSNGKYYLIASKSLYLGAEYELSLNNVDKGRAIRVDFQLEMGVFHIKGKVTDADGKPLSDVLIKETYQNTGNSVYSDNDGNYKLELYPYSEYSNKYVLKASVADYYSQEYALNFTEKDYGRTSMVNFQLTTSVKPTLYCTIAGSCKGTNGAGKYANKGVPNVTIRGYKAKRSDYSDKIMDVKTTTDDNGNFKIKQEIDIDYPYHIYTPEIPYGLGLKYVTDCNGESGSSYKITLTENDASKTFIADFLLW